MSFLPNFNSSNVSVHGDGWLADNRIYSFPLSLKITVGYPIINRVNSHSAPYKNLSRARLPTIDNHHAISPLKICNGAKSSNDAHYRDKSSQYPTPSTSTPLLTHRTPRRKQQRWFTTGQHQIEQNPGKAYRCASFDGVSAI